MVGETSTLMASDPFSDESSSASVHSSTDMLPKHDPSRSDSSEREAGSTWGDVRRPSRRRKVIFWLLTIAVIAIAIMFTVWLILISILVARLSPKPNDSGVQRILDDWHNGTSTPPLWLEDFTKDVVAIPCHSHNDYSRTVPLYDALAAGCTGVEADVWPTNLTGTPDLLVGHKKKGLRADRSLKSLYIQPLLEILHNQQSNSSNETDSLMPVGVFDESPNTTLVLLIDFKTDAKTTWPIVMDQLSTLRDEDWLSYWNGSQFVTRPLTIVVTGNADFNDVVALNGSHRDVFFDAPLAELEPKYNASTSLYASSSMSHALGFLSLTGLRKSQLATMQDQISKAQDSGLRSRYWSTPSWPVSWRNSIWMTLLDKGVGMLNVDELVTASRWDWGWCVVAGITLCG